MFYIFADQKVVFMSDSMQNIGLKQIRKLVSAQRGLELGDDFFIINVKYSEDLQFLKYPCRSDAYIAIFCKSGRVNIELNLRSYTVSEKMLFLSTPGNIVKVNETSSNDLDASSFIVLAISKEYLTSIHFDFKKLFDDRLNLLSDPCVQLSDKNLSFCSEYLELFDSLMKSDFANRKEAVGALIASLFYVLSGQVETNLEKLTEPKAPSSSTRMKLLFEHFMSLVTEYHTSQRNMSFYADSLGLTPKYLSKLIKHISGRSGPDWIDSFVILEAKNMLKYTDVSIKEIVYNLHFPNPSVFYKFFKTHTGITPSEYRNG